MSKTRTHQPLAIPSGYLVPLHDENKPAQSYVLAFTRWLRKKDVFDLLPAASSFTGHEIPFRKREVLSFPLNRPGLKQLPNGLFPRGLLIWFDWSKGKPEDFLATFVKRYGRKGYYLALPGDVLILREGKPPRKPFLGMPVGTGALWRTARTTILVDLDSLLRNLALQALQFATSDIGTIAGTLSHESGILAGRGMKWDSTRGRFFSPVETTEAYQRERLERLDRLADILFRRPVHMSRLAAVRPMVFERAKATGRSARAEWKESRRQAISLIVPAVYSKMIASFAKIITQSPPRPLKDWGSDLDAFRYGLIKKLRAGVNATMTADFLGSDWRNVHRKVELKGVQVAAPEEDEQVEPQVEIEEVLAGKYGRLLMGRAHLTPKEKLILGALATIGKGDSLAEWAQRNGMAPSTARGHRMRAIAKLEAAKKLT